MGVEKTTEDRWYVLRDLARLNAKFPAYKQLQAMPEMAGCVFIPLKQRVFIEFGKRVVRLVPYLPDLIFVHKSREELDPIVGKQKLLQYRYVRGGRQFEAMTVPHESMARFIEAVTQTAAVEYYSLDEVSPPPLRQARAHHRRPAQRPRGPPDEQARQQVQAPAHRPRGMQSLRRPAGGSGVYSVGGIRTGDRSAPLLFCNTSFKKVQ